MTAGYRESEVIWNRKHQRDTLSERDRDGGTEKKNSSRIRKFSEERTRERKGGQGALTRLLIECDPSEADI